MKTKFKWRIIFGLYLIPAIILSIPIIMLIGFYRVFSFLSDNLAIFKNKLIDKYKP